jgi:DNA-binding CsgD family transcriptional regulator
VKPAESRIHVVIAARPFIYRLGIKTIISVLGIEPELHESENFEDLVQLLKQKKQLNFIIIHDDVFPRPKRIHFERLRSASPDHRILILGDKIQNEYKGADFILNDYKRLEVIQKLEEFFSNPESYSDAFAGKTILSNRETDVLKKVALGYSNKEIAEGLHISINTVITHRKNITEKLGIKTIAGLTVYAMMNRLISPEHFRS